MRMRYTAWFSNDIKQTRVSHRIYSHAWRVFVVDHGMNEYGFAGNAVLASKAADSCAYQFRKNGQKCQIEIVRPIIEPYQAGGAR